MVSCIEFVMVNFILVQLVNVFYIIHCLVFVLLLPEYVR
jgi:hypothetical protein